MPEQDTPRLEIRITRHFAAAPAAVFAEWLDADALKDWFAPETFTGQSATADPRPGGKWSVEYLSSEGTKFSENGTYLEIQPNTRLVMTLIQSFLPDTVLTIEVTFTEQSGGTLMQFHQTGITGQRHRDGMELGWFSCFDKLGQRIEDPKAAILQLFNDWFDASQRKDLDASMAPISDDIVSYEHTMPLEVRDIALMRTECKQGFDRAGPEFRWDVPDLQIIVRGDIAVTWGLNRMAEHANGVLQSAMWSRGTRIFQKCNGRWKMIHQHVSFPMDPSTGQARHDLAPNAPA